MMSSMSSDRTLNRRVSITKLLHTLEVFGPLLDNHLHLFIPGVVCSLISFSVLHRHVSPMYTSLCALVREDSVYLRMRTDPPLRSGRRHCDTPRGDPHAWPHLQQGTRLRGLRSQRRLRRCGAFVDFAAGGSQRVHFADGAHSHARAGPGSRSPQGDHVGTTCSHCAPYPIS